MSIKDKLTSRKFWLCTAALLSSIGTTIAGFATDKSTVAIAGIVCCAISSAIYSVCEALVDAEAVGQG